MKRYCFVLITKIAPACYRYLFGYTLPRTERSFPNLVCHQRCAIGRVYGRGIPRWWLNDRTIVFNHKEVITWRCSKYFERFLWWIWSPREHMAWNLAVHVTFMHLTANVSREQFHRENGSIGLSNFYLDTPTHQKSQPLSRILIILTYHLFRMMKDGDLTSWLLPICIV